MDPEDSETSDSLAAFDSDAPLLNLHNIDEDVTENFNLKFGNDYLLPAKPDDPPVDETASSSLDSDTATSKKVRSSKRRAVLTKPTKPVHAEPKRVSLRRTSKRKTESTDAAKCKKTPRLKENAKEAVESSSETGKSSSKSKTTQSDDSPEASISPTVKTTQLGTDAIQEEVVKQKTVKPEALIAETVKPEAAKAEAVEQEVTNALCCPFKRIPSATPLTKGVMVNHENLLAMNPKYLSVCPLCIQKCSLTKESSYDMLMHLALHKGVQNLHCLCSNCGRYVGRYMEKVGSTTNIINQETFANLWPLQSMQDIKWRDVCKCTSPEAEVIFDCVIDTKCFMNLVLLKMQKQPNSKIEVFTGARLFKEHLESHQQVALASSLCELCWEDPRYCHYRIFRGQYVAIEEDLCANVKYHQGLEIRHSSFYCRMFSRRPIVEKQRQELDKKTLFQRPSSFKPCVPGSLPPEEVRAVGSTPAGPRVYKVVDTPTALSEAVKTASLQGSPTIVRHVKKKAQVARKKTAAPVQKKQDSLSAMPDLDGLHIPFKIPDWIIHDDLDLDIRHSFPKLRCPAYKDGCQFASWHLKLMDAHIKAHLQRVNLFVMFSCLCSTYYHNLFDLFLHLQEKHGHTIKNEEELSSIDCVMENDEEDEECGEKEEKTLRDLLFQSKDEDPYICRFETFTWINKLVVASGFIRKVTTADAMRTTWLESPTDVESWIREEIHAMDLYRGRKFNMPFEDVPFLDAYLTISVEEMENDLDFLWAQMDGDEDETKPLPDEEYAKSVPDASDDEEEDDHTLHLWDHTKKGYPSQVQVVAPLLKMSNCVQVMTFNCVPRGKRTKTGLKRYSITSSAPPSGPTPFTLLTQLEHIRSRVQPRDVGDGDFSAVGHGAKVDSITHQKKTQKFERTWTQLPKDYQLPPNVNRCQYADMSVISMAGVRGHTQVKLVLKEIDDVSYHQCPFCNKAETDIFSISRHLNKHHKTLQDDEEHSSALCKKHLLMLCRHCNFVTFSIIGCWLHFQNAHNGRLWPQIDKGTFWTIGPTGVWNNIRISTFTCTECGWNLFSKRELISHMKTTHSEGQCSSVQLGFVQTIAVTATGKDVVYVCAFCDEIQDKLERMESHVFRSHSHNRILYVCMYCTEFNTAYFTKSLTFTHYIEEHTTCVPLWCSVSLVGDLDKSTFNRKSAVTRSCFKTEWIVNPSAAGRVITSCRGTGRARKTCTVASLPAECSTVSGHANGASDGLLGVAEVKDEPTDSKEFIGVEINSSGDVIQTFILPLQQTSTSTIASTSTSVTSSANHSNVIKGKLECKPKTETTDDSVIKIVDVTIKEEPKDDSEDQAVVHVKDELAPEIKEIGLIDLGSNTEVLNLKPDNNDVDLDEILQAASKNISLPDELSLRSDSQDANVQNYVSEEDMILVMSSDGQQYYVPKEQLAQYVGEQNLPDS